MEDKCQTEQSFDMSSEMKRLFKEKEIMRAAAREYFMKAVYNPYREINTGPPFDPAMQRFSAMSAYHAEYFKPKPKSILGALAALLIPYITLYKLFKWERSRREEKYRAGLVPYEERDYKLYN